MGLTERHSRTAYATYWRGRIPVQYVYTAGRVGERFSEGVATDRLVATAWPSCDVVYVPPRIYCEHCFAGLEDSFVEVAPEGRVHTFTICHKGQGGSQKGVLLVISMINIDDTNGGLVHYIGEVRPEDLRIDMSAEAVFKPKEQRKGSVLHIQYFKPKE